MHKAIVPMAAITIIVASSVVSAGPAQDSILKHFQQQAGTPFSAERGKALFITRHGSGKPETPSCTTCHGNSPLKTGSTRAGKEIAPMALSRTPDRYSALKKVEKWFRRNCRSVLGRECTLQEKGDFLTFMINQ